MVQLVAPDGISQVKGFAVETLKEIETFKIAKDSYGYVFYVLQRSN
jgi:hypothetical protein